MIDNIKQVQSRALEMAISVEKILNSHSIPHSIMYGTLLGAVRHGGFIPWDDDFDFCIMDDCYDDAIRILKSEASSSLFVEDEETEPNFFHAWARIKDLNSEVIREYAPQDSIYAHQGICIDLFRMKKIRLSDICDVAEEEFFNYIRRKKKLGLLSPDDNASKYDKMSGRTRWFWNNYAKDEDISTIHREVFSNVYTDILYYEIEDFFPLKPINFENTSFLGPNNPDKVLRAIYSDYMALPDEDRRRHHYSNVILS